MSDVKGWAVVDREGVRHEVVLRPRRNGWVADGASDDGASYFDAQILAVLTLAVERQWLIADVLAPGEVGRAEMAEAHDRTLTRLEVADTEVARLRAVETQLTRERDALRMELDHKRACSTVKCPSCNGRGKVLCAREVEDGCDDCEASGTVPAVAEVDRLTARVAQLEAALNGAMTANVERLTEMEAQVERVAAERDAAVREGDRRAWGVKERARALAARYADDVPTLRRMLTEMGTTGDALLHLEAGSTTPPDAEAIEAHEAAHGGFWFVSRVVVGGGDRGTRPMVLRISLERGPRYTWVRATFPGYDIGGVLEENPWSAMEGATFTRLDADGVMLLTGGPRA